MAGLIKNQILKHLSKFTKNLSSDKINVSTLKGEGELSNLELNEDILTNLLELPTWLRITKAVCNRVAVKIQWTKLKSQPICLYLDEVIVETETCQEPRPPSNPSQAASGSKYGFVDRVMDGIFVHVNSVIVKLVSHKFHASLQLSRVKVQSMSPTWQQPSDLRSTRIRDGTRGEILLFKEIEWQTTRIEATAISSDEDFLTPLRLIANQAKIRIVVKKRMSDCAIISSRLTLLLDDLLWVLTITQLKAAILYANSLKEVIERSAKQSKQLAAEKLKKQGHIGDPQYQQQQQQHSSAPDRQESTTAKYFNKFDVVSTSYHLITSRFDLHLCDDSSPADDEKRHWKINGGSMQITFYKLSIDFYPFHPADIERIMTRGGERKSWHRYLDNVGSRNPWVNNLFAQFREEAIKLRKVCESSAMPSSSSAPSLLTSHPSPSTSPTAGQRKQNLTPTRQANGTGQGGRNSIASTRTPQSSPSHQPQGQRSTRLLESCFVVKMEDLTVYMVSMPGQKRTGHHKLLCSDKRQLHLPPDMSVVHVEFTDYFFPDGLEYPVPHPNLYVLVNPVRLTLDFLTLLWSNVFLLTLSQSVDMDFGEEGKQSEHMDIKVELLMPRVIVPAEEKLEGQPDRPDAIQLQISKLVVTNTRTEERMGQDDLRSTLDQYQSSRLFSNKEFPMDDRQGEEPGKDLIPQLLYDHSLNKDNPFLDKNVKTLLTSPMPGLKLSPSDPSVQEIDTQTLHAHQLPSHHLSTNSLKRAASADVWSASAEQVWLEFLGVQNFKNRPVPFVEAIPVTLWFCAIQLPKRLRTKSAGGEKTGIRTQDILVGKVGQEDVIGKDGTASSGVGHSRSIRNESLPLNHQQHPTSNMPVVGSSPPVSDSPLTQGRRQLPQPPPGASDNSRHVSGRSQDRDGRPDPHGDGNSTAGHHHFQRNNNSDYRKSQYEDDDHRPSKLSISGSGHVGDGPHRVKTRSRSDSPYREEFSGGRMSSSHRGEQYGESPQQSLRESQRYQRENSRHQDSAYNPSRNVSGEGNDPHGRFTGEEAAQRRRRDRLQREDSRSSSSPPMGGQRVERGCLRDESRDRKSKDRRQRHSSSSSSERRETDGYRSGEGVSGERRRDRSDGRSNGEGQGSERVGSDGRGWRGEEIEQRGVSEEDRRRARATRQHSSSSSSERVSELSGRAGSRGRRGHQSGSRDRRTSPLDRQMEEREDTNGGQRVREESWHREDVSPRRSVKDGSRSSVDRRDSDWDRRSGQLGDGIPPPHDRQSRYGEEWRASESSVGESRSGRGRLQRSLSRDRDPETYNYPREEEVGRTHIREVDHSRNSISESQHKSRQPDSDCDNDLFSLTSPSSADTIGGHDGGPDVRCQGQSQNSGQRSQGNNDSTHGNSQGQTKANQAWTSKSNRPPPDGCKAQDNISHLELGSGPPKPDPEAKICVLAKIPGKLRLQINHFQYLFLMRLLESFSAFQTDLTADLLAITSLNAKTCMKQKSSNFASESAPPSTPQLPPSPIIFVPLFLKELEVAVVCPYQMHQRTFSDDFSIISPFLQGYSTGQDAVFGEDPETTCFPQLVDYIGGRQIRDDSSLRPPSSTISFKSHSSSQLENMGYPAPAPPPPIDALVRTSKHLPKSGDTPVPQTSMSSAESSTKKEPSDSMSQSINSLGRDSGIGIDRKPTPQNRQQMRGAESRGSALNKAKGSTDVKKAFTSAFSSFTDKLKNKMEGLEDGAGDDLETMSIRTDTSDDDFEHLSLADDAEEVPAFFHDPPPPDVASVADSYSEQGEPGDSVSMYAESSTTKGKEMVYVVLFKLDHTEVILDLGPDETVSRIQLGRLASLQLGNISYDDFQGRFSSPKGYIQDECTPAPPAKSPVRCKFSVQAPDPAKPDSLPDPGRMTIKAEDFSLQFKMSGLTCLSDFAEDEKLSEPVPMSLDVVNLLLVLEEDRPPVNLTSPGALPMNLHIQQLSIERGKDGVFYLSGSPISQQFTPPMPPSPRKPKTTNAVTSPIMSPDGTMALLMASQNEAVLLRRQLEEVRRANRLYEHQILQWREMQDQGGFNSIRPNGSRSGSFVGTRKRQSFTGESQSTISCSSASSGMASDMPAHHSLQQNSAIARGLAGEEVDPVREELEKENLILQQRMTRLEDDLLTVSKEKESLLQTLQLLQDELLASERKQRAKTK